MYAIFLKATYIYVLSKDVEKNIRKGMPVSICQTKQNIHIIIEFYKYCIILYLPPCLLSLLYFWMYCKWLQNLFNTHWAQTFEEH